MRIIIPKSELKASLENIEEHIADHLSVEEIAGSVFFSKFHYQRLFHEFVGDSLMAYVKKRRLSLAGKELLETEDTVLDIALRWGYGNHGSFTRAFKAYMGVTPADYRKYGLSAISKKAFEKECVIMSNSFLKGSNQQYTNTSEDILREVNSIIVQLKDTAVFGLKNSAKAYIPFFKLIAAKCDDFAEQLRAVTKLFENVGGFSEISNRLAVVKAVEDVSFYTNILAFNVALYISRANEDDREAMEPICERFTLLAQGSAAHTGKITEICKEIAAMIQADMKNTALMQAKDSIEIAKGLVNSIKGYSYLKDEINAIVQELSAMPYENLRVNTLDDLIFRADIIALTASLDSTRNPADTDMLNGPRALSESLAETKEFIRDIDSLRYVDEKPIFVRSDDKYFKDMAFQGNILYFYLKGELEKMGALLSPEDKEIFHGVLTQLSEFIHSATKAAELCNTLGFDCKNALAGLSDSILSIESQVRSEGEKFGAKGSALIFFSNQFKVFAQKIQSV